MLKAARGLFFLLVLLSAASCMKGPEEKLTEHMRKGKELMGSSSYREAILEFKNAVQLAPKDAQARHNLGLAYLSAGGQNIQLAYKEFSAAVELDPGLNEAQLKLGEFLLLAGNFDDARKKAVMVLDKDPANTEAKVLLAGAYAGVRQGSKALSILEEVIASKPANIRPYMAAATVHLSSGNHSAAEQVLRKSLETFESSIEVRLALSNLLARKGDLPGAEAEIKKAVELNKDSQEPLIALAAFYSLMPQRQEDAHKAFESAINVKPENPAGYLAYSRFLTASGRATDATRVLGVGFEKTKSPVLQKSMIELQIEHGKYKEASEGIESILKKNRDPEALYLSGRLKLAQRDLNGAIEDLNASLKSNPDSAQARFRLALAYQATGNLQTAKSELLEAVRLAPGYLDARIALANAYMGIGDNKLAAKEVQSLLEKHPAHPGANLLMGDILLRQKQFAGAKSSFEKVVKAARNDPRGYARLGTVYQLQGNSRIALENFERALEMNPEMIDVLSMIASIHISNGQPARGLNRITAQLEKYPKNPHMHHLLGRVYVVLKDYQNAEKSLKQALSLKNDLIGVYMDLGNIYALQGLLDNATSTYEETIRINPKYISGHMMLGILYERKGRTKDAIESYKKVLDIDSKFGPAANNLAYLYSEGGGNIDVALSLAETAKEQLPNDPGISDTLGWIYYKKGAYLKAISHLKESAEKLPDNPVVRFHLGMAYYRKGDFKMAKEELSKSLRLNGKHPHSEEARRVLGEMK